MKKLNLKKLRLASEEILGKNDLFNIYGGSGGTGTCYATCNHGCSGTTTDCSNATMNWFCKDDGGPAFCSFN